MQIGFDCPRCLQRSVTEVAESAAVGCAHCEWQRAVPEGGVTGNVPQQCLVCGCSDLWRQKDFPPLLGVLMVGMGILLSTIAVAYMRPVLALGILMAFALVDMLLFLVMRDRLVCYRCHAVYRRLGDLQHHAKFDLELNERYRQESIRRQAATRPDAVPGSQPTRD